MESKVTWLLKEFVSIVSSLYITVLFGMAGLNSVCFNMYMYIQIKYGRLRHCGTKQCLMPVFA